MNGVSIIICCYNSSNVIHETLQRIAIQQTNDLPLELIVVDNNSTDNTVSIVECIWKKIASSIPFKLIYEEKQGLNYARMKGVSIAKYNVIIFCDDDNWLHPNYAVTAYDILQWNNKIAIAGGHAIGEFEVNPPSWFEPFSYALVIGKPLNKSGFATDRKYLTGAGMVIRKSFLDELKNIDFASVLSDRKGKQLSSGGDSELCLLAILMGYQLYFDDRLVFNHYIPSFRISWSYIVSLISKGFSEPQFSYYSYEYCYSAIMNNKQADFKYAYRKNLKKPILRLYNEINSFKKFIEACSFIFKSIPGSEKEIRIKTNLHKLQFLITQRRKIKQQFNVINACVNRLIEHKKSYLNS